MELGLNRPAGALDGATALRPYRGALNVRLAAHLLRRAGFGGTAGDIARFAAMSPHAAAEALLRFGGDGDQAPGNVFDPRPQIATLRRGDTAARRAAFAALRKEMRGSILEMQLWWLNRMLQTSAPLQEKMTLFFHGHFTTAAIQKGVWPPYVWNQNQLFRANALGNLRTLTLAVSKDPAMLLYLDNALSVKAHPNENYARELMELFTLGHGNYSEEDVRQSARAFTGWTVNRRTGEFVRNARLHDDGSKTFLGRSGNFDGNDIVDIIYGQPACSRFWSQSILNRFLYNDPEPQLIDAFAKVIEKNDYELRPTMSTLLQSEIFYSPRAYRSLVKSPVEFAVGTYGAFGIPQVEAPALRALNQMGQILFYPPNVAGWPGGTNWITSQTVLARENFVAGLVNSRAMESSWIASAPMDVRAASEQLIARVLQGDAPRESVAQLESYLDGNSTAALRSLSAENYQERVRGAAYLTAAMPAYQLN